MAVRRAEKGRKSACPAARSPQPAGHGLARTARLHRRVDPMPTAVPWRPRPRVQREAESAADGGY